MTNRAIPGAIAASATATATGLSVLAGLQRGGLPAERAILVALGVVLCAAAHLIPSLCKKQGATVRVIGALLWVGCMAATCYGHAVFFTFASQHAGQARASLVTDAVVTGRDSVTIARDRAVTAGELARANAMHCYGNCPALKSQRAKLTGDLAALDVERDAAKLDHARADKRDAERSAALTDPITAALTTSGIGGASSGLVTGLAFAFVLEGVACFCWMLALCPVERQEPATAANPAPFRFPHELREIEITRYSVATRTETMPVTRDSGTVTQSRAVSSEPVTDVMPAPVEPPASDEVERVRAAVRSNQVRATVADVRKFLGCSQTRASAIRKQLDFQKGQQ